MKGFDAYEIYMGVRAAFIADFDYFKYGGKMKLTDESFLTNKNKWQYTGLSKKFDSTLELQSYLALAFMLLPINKCWITNLLRNNEFLKSYSVFQEVSSNRIENLQRSLTAYTNLDEMKSDFVSKANSFPPLYEEWLAEPTYEKLNYLILMDEYYNLFSNWNITHKGNYVWDDFYKRVLIFKKFYTNTKPISPKIIQETIEKHFTLPK